MPTFGPDNSTDLHAGRPRPAEEGRASGTSRTLAFPERKLHRVQSLRYEAVSDLGATLVGQCADPHSIGSRLHFSARRMSPWPTAAGCDHYVCRRIWLC